MTTRSLQAHKLTSTINVYQLPNNVFGNWGWTPNARFQCPWVQARLLSNASVMLKPAESRFMHLPLNNQPAKTTNTRTGTKRQTHRLSLASQSGKSNLPGAWPVRARALGACHTAHPSRDHPSPHLSRTCSESYSCFKWSTKLPPNTAKNTNKSSELDRISLKFSEISTGVRTPVVQPRGSYLASAAVPKAVLAASGAFGWVENQISNMMLARSFRPGLGQVPFFSLWPFGCLQISIHQSILLFVHDLPKGAWGTPRPITATTDLSST